MTFRKRFLTALTAAALSVSSVPAVLNAPVTAATSNTIYDDFDIVPYYMFETDSSTEAQDKLERAFRTATKKDVGSIPLISFCFQIALARTSSTMLNR